MNVSPLFRTVYQTINFIAARITWMTPCRNINSMCIRECLHSWSGTTKLRSSGLLQPSIPMYNSTCGLKMKTVLHRRCKHCIVFWKEDRKYIMCKEHPRHNQVQRKKLPYKTWILTHACQKPVREW